MSTRPAAALACALLLAAAPLCPPLAHASPLGLVPSDSRIDFTVKEMGVPVQGRFARFGSDVDIDLAHLAASHAEIRIDVGSLTTGSDEADAIAVGPDWLDKAHTPTAVFRSSAFRALGGNRFEATGTLTLHGRTKALTVPFTRTDLPQGRTLVACTLSLHREDFGIGAGDWNQPGIVADDIPVTVRLVLAPGANGAAKG